MCEEAGPAEGDTSELRQYVEERLDALHQNIVCCTNHTERKFEEFAGAMALSERRLRHDLGEATRKLVANAMDLVERGLHREVEAAVTSKLLQQQAGHTAEGGYRAPPDDLQAWMADLVQVERRVRTMDSSELRQGLEHVKGSIGADVRKLEDESLRSAAHLEALREQCNKVEAATASSFRALEASLRHIARQLRIPDPLPASTEEQELQATLPNEGMALVDNSVGRVKPCDPMDATCCPDTAVWASSPAAMDACSAESSANASYKWASPDTPAAARPTLQHNLTALPSQPSQPHAQQISHSSPRVRSDLRPSIGAAGKFVCDGAPPFPAIFLSPRAGIVPPVAVASEQQRQQCVPGFVRGRAPNEGWSVSAPSGVPRAASHHSNQRSCSGTRPHMHGEERPSSAARAAAQLPHDPSRARMSFPSSRVDSQRCSAESSRLKLRPGG